MMPAPPSSPSSLNRLTRVALAVLSLVVVALVWRNHELSEALEGLRASAGRDALALAQCRATPVAPVAPGSAAAAPALSAPPNGSPAPAAPCPTQPVGGAAPAGTPAASFEDALKARLKEQQALQRSPFERKP